MEPTLVYRWADVITVDIDPRPPAVLDIEPGRRIELNFTLTPESDQ